ncbi:Sulfotransferase family cytosolic 1B member 1 [Holothuria leucospilota]|uniref:Sulfotransferase family cytosolic 1B member 1 n=1 Tax=Holothuria leucospilota TaxID=206669 RepID=A0A9Q0YNG3_HOLLE|nr:Sulfotransferase family cytosolic 1B member 1 [Holothuria leucospilota]
MAHLAVGGKLPDHIKNYLTACDDGSFLPITTPSRYLPDILEMEIKPSDIIVNSWPKSGTTWMQYIVTQIICGEEFLKQTVHVIHKNIFIESAQNPLKLEKSEGMYKIAENYPSPRLLKSHLKLPMLPKCLLDKKAKVIYVVRNPKDAAVSFFNYCRKRTTYPYYKDWQEFYEHFCNGLLPYGDWFEHVLTLWARRNESNVLIIKYEDMKKDLTNTVHSVSKFLRKPLSERELADICDRSSFDAMKENPIANPDLTGILLRERDPIPFMRKGVIGDWKNYFTVAQNEHFDELYRQKIKGSGLELDFE